MKKLTAFLLACMMLLCLCACGGNSTEPTDGTTAAPTESQGASTETTAPVETTQPLETTVPVTACSHTYTSTVTQEASCTAEGVLTYTCENCGDSYTEAIAMVEHSYADATCTTAKTCTVCGETSGEALGHSYTDATCTKAKTCTVCGETSGEALGHDYADGTCTRCGAEDESYFALVGTDWKLLGLNMDGSYLHNLTLRFYADGTGAIFDGYYDPAKLNAISEDSYIDYNGVRYYETIGGDCHFIDYTVDGSQIICSVEGSLGTITLIRDGGDQLKVAEVAGSVSGFPVGKVISSTGVFTAKQ